MLEQSKRTADGQPVPRQRAERPREHALLALQQRAGNAAVTRMIQRKIGFELESGHWRSAALKGAPTEQQRTAGTIPKGVVTKRKSPKAREKFYEADGIRGTADELPGDVRDVEFVIAEREETDAKGIAAAFDKVGELYDALNGKRTEDAWIWPEAQLGWVPPDKHTWLLDNPSGAETHVQLQATAGMPLDQLAQVAARLDPDPGEATRSQTGTHPMAEAAIATARQAAGEAVADFDRVHGGLGGSGALVGMLTLMAQFLIGGTPDPENAAEATYSYPKAIAAILPRTDFASMFRTLPEPVQKRLGELDRMTNRYRFTGLVMLLSKHTPNPGLDRPVFTNQAWKQIDDKLILPDLTRRAWADGIVEGEDRITRTGYLEWLEGRGSQVDPSEYADRKKEAAQLDSIGGYGKKMDKGATEDLPLVEFRALVDSAQRGVMTVPQAKVVGVRLAAYVDKMVNRKL
jgi:hypothetical protein